MGIMHAITTHCTSIKGLAGAIKLYLEARRSEGAGTTDAFSFFGCGHPLS